MATPHAYPLIMKIIAGDRKGHTIRTPDGMKTRPTLSRVRESLFSIIAGDVPGTVFCELFAGSGSIALEALSRGASHAIMVEQARGAANCLRDNIKRLRYESQSTVIQTDVYRWQMPAGASAPDIIFADPPYEPSEIDKFVVRLERWDLKPNALVILQTSAGYEPKVSLKHLRTANYGNTALHFYLVDPSTATVAVSNQPVTESK